MTSFPAIKTSLSTNGLMFLTALLTAMTLFALLSLTGLIAYKGIGHFWIKPVVQVQYKVAGELQLDFGFVLKDSINQAGQQRLWLMRDSYQYSRPDRYLIIDNENIQNLTYDPDIYHFYLSDGRQLLAKPNALLVGGEHFDWQYFADYQRQVAELLEQKRRLQLGQLADVHEGISDLRRRKVPDDAPASQRLIAEYQSLSVELSLMEAQIAQYQMQVLNAEGAVLTLPLQDIVRIMVPNQFTVLDKVQELLKGMGRFLSESTQEANQSGGVFPAIFGTVLMVLLMTVIVAPLGIVAAIYLTEYAPNNTVITIIRIAVSNLAGVPSVVYGVFGLGFFVYQVGGNIDALFYGDKLPTATFGSPGLLWASLTMALLTLPVVIVATEEGLRRVPNGLRSASYALGATKFETIRSVVVPVASSSLMTGVILAIARGAGEVAPMLMVGAVKYAPVLPIDGEFPFIHLERQFMHLGVLIYDGAFHGKVIQGGSTMMFAACLLLLLVVTLLNLVAIIIRNRLQSVYHTAHYARVI